MHLEPNFDPVLASDEASGLGDYYWESDFEYLFSFHSLVVGKIAVLLVAIVKVDTTRDAFVKVAFTLEMVEIVTWLVEA